MSISGAKILKFSKFQGSGNDFVIIDDLEKRFPCENAELIQRLCHRQFGIGADGLILVQRSVVADYRMRIFNSDGLEALMCGNGLRCLVLYLYKNLEKNKSQFLIESLKGVHLCYKENAYIHTSLQVPLIKHLSKKFEEIDIHVIDTGVPHAVVFVQDLQENFFIQKSRKIRFHEMFAPEGVNVNFAFIGNSDEIFIRTYERGVEDETMACGTGAAAVAVAARSVYRMQSPIQIVFKSKEKLFCYLEEREDEISKISLCGLSKHVFDGKVDLNELYSLIQ